jgi:hypothetical protein
MLRVRHFFMLDVGDLRDMHSRFCFSTLIRAPCRRPSLAAAAATMPAVVELSQLQPGHSYFKRRGLTLTTDSTDAQT